MENKWVSKELFEKSLRNFYKNEDIVVLKYENKPAVPTGDNYTSDVMRTNITFQEKGKPVKNLSVIVKIQARGNIVEEWTIQLNFFKTEMEMFSKTFPLIYNILGPEMNGYLSSVCLLTTETPNLMLVLEDLKPYGFQMASRRMGFDLDHCLMVMKKIAVFHAASLVMVENDPTTVENYGKGLFTEADVSFQWISKGFKSLAESCKSWPGCEKYAAKLEKLGENAVKRGIQAGTKDIDGFHVLNHGDMWANNMLFSYHENGRLKDLKFVDFQLVKYSSPAVDLHYFYATSPSQEARDKLDLLLDTYYAQLISVLTSLKYSLEKVPTRKELKLDFERRAFYGVMAAATVAPLVRASQRKDATFEDLAYNDGPGSFREHCYTNEVYTDLMTFLLPYYDSLGVLD